MTIIWYKWLNTDLFKQRQQDNSKTDHFLLRNKLILSRKTRKTGKNSLFLSTSPFVCVCVCMHNRVCVYVCMHNRVCVCQHRRMVSRWSSTCSRSTTTAALGERWTVWCQFNKETDSSCSEWGRLLATWPQTERFPPRCQLTQTRGRLSLRWWRGSALESS